jgi:hypothetical protein
MGLLEGGLQRVAQPLFRGLVRCGAARVFVEDDLPLPSRGLAQQFGDPGIEVGRFAEALPDVIPSTTTVRQLGRGSRRGIVVGIDVQLGATDSAERPPACFVLALTEASGITHPAQDVADWIRDRQLVKVLGFQAMATQGLNRRFGKERKRPAQRLSRARVLREFQAETFVRQEKRFDGPVAAVPLMPDAPPILELNQRLQSRSAIARSPQLLAADAGQIKSRNLPRRRCNLRD